jgi:hypothetical protein
VCDLPKVVCSFFEQVHHKNGCCQFNDTVNINAWVLSSKKELGTKGVQNKTPVFTGVLGFYRFCGFSNCNNYCF